ncbi:MAG: lysophospholipid acyltransferase family protein [Bacteroidales bacterium]|nr:lysophospholipid acyltransferase family protein [Bacteroidales bacterium]
MNKVFSYPLTFAAYISFILIICVFHPIQYISLKLFGYEAHKKSVDVLNYFLLHVLLLTFSSCKVEFEANIPEDKPIIFVSNHQGLYDIIGIAWFLRKYHPKFVSKVELGKGIPSVSFNLKHGGSVLIDRKDPKQALPVLKQLGEYIETHKRSAVIFPEGTRSTTGAPKTFAPNGLKILCKYAPNALVVPISVNNSWKLFQYGSFPLGMGNKIAFTVHAPIAVKEFDYNSLFEMTEKAIVDGIVN